MTDKLFPTDYDELTALARALKLLIVDETEPLDEDKLKWVYLETLMKHGPYASKVRSVTASGDVDLANSDPIFIEVDPDGSDRDVNCPTAGSDNHIYVVRHVGSANTLTLKRSGGAEVGRLNADETLMIIPSSANDFVALKNRSNLSTAIEGLKLSWNSATSITVGTGHCYAENGDEIDLTSAITKSGLSLSSSTWYHVYVYLSGTPAAEIVTTAPTAWKGPAYSKTGDTSRRYVGSVLTDGSGNIYEFMHNLNNNQIVYKGSSVTNTSPFRVLNGGTSTSPAEVDVSGVIPSETAIMIYARFASNANVTTNIGTDSSVSNLSLNPGSTSIQNAYIAFAVNSTPGIYYDLGSGYSSGGVYIDIYGYYFER